jgi:hypothetical protein
MAGKTVPEKLTTLAEDQENLKNNITLAYKIAPQTTSTNALAVFSRLKLHSTEFTRKTLENYHHQSYTQTLANNANEQREIARVVAQLKRAFNKGDEATSQQSKKSTNDMLHRFTMDSEKAVHILQTYKLKIIDLENELALVRDPSKKQAIQVEGVFTQTLVAKLEADLKTLPTTRSRVTNTMSRNCFIERFAHSESHNNLCKDLIRKGKEVESDRFVNMTNASFNMLKNYLGDGLAIMASTQLEENINEHHDIGMHACPLLCVVPTQDTIDKIYNIVTRLHVPYQPKSDEVGKLVQNFSGNTGIGTTNVSTSSGISSPSAPSRAQSREMSAAPSTMQMVPGILGDRDGNGDSRMGQ